MNDKPSFTIDLWIVTITFSWSIGGHNEEEEEEEGGYNEEQS